MSEESTTPHPAERVRQFVEAANRGELDAAPSYLARDSVWDTSRVGIGVFEGAATIRRFMEDWFRGYEELQFVIDELLDVGSGVVLTVTRQMARPVGTTGYVQQREGWVWVWSDGRCASVTVYPEAVIDEARAAAERLAAERR
jgi:ketosteroid isomerase-like protein